MAVLRWALGSATVIAVVWWANAPYMSLYPVTAGEDVLIGVTFAATGAALYGDPQQRSNASLFWLVSALYVAGGVGGHDVGPWPLIEYLSRPLMYVALAAVLLRYPEQRLRRRYERTFLLVSLLVLVPLRVVAVALSRPDWHAYSPTAWWLTVGPLPEAYDLIRNAEALAEALLAIAFAPLIIIRVRHSTGIDRQMLRPVAAAVIGVGLFSTAESVVEVFGSNDDLVYLLVVLEGAALALIPVAFLVAAVRRRLSYVAVGDLVRALNRPVTIDQIRSALRTSLNDPILEVAYWLPEYAGYFDTGGRLFDATTLPAGRRLVSVTSSDDSPLAIVAVDESMRRYQSLLDTTLSAAALALENGPCRPRSALS